MSFLDNKSNFNFCTEKQHDYVKNTRNQNMVKDKTLLNALVIKSFLGKVTPPVFPGKTGGVESFKVVNNGSDLTRGQIMYILAENALRVDRVLNFFGETALSQKLRI